MKKKNIGSPVDDWLREEGIYEETTAIRQDACSRPQNHTARRIPYADAIGFCQLVICSHCLGS
jgi:hypothetical protein